jgi:hypothetical protein
MIESPAVLCADPPRELALCMESDYPEAAAGGATSLIRACQVVGTRTPAKRSCGLCGCDQMCRSGAARLGRSAVPSSRSRPARRSSLSIRRAAMPVRDPVEIAPDEPPSRAFPPRGGIRRYPVFVRTERPRLRPRAFPFRPRPAIRSARRCGRSSSGLPPKLGLKAVASTVGTTRSPRSRRAAGVVRTSLDPLTQVMLRESLDSHSAVAEPADRP